MPMDMGIGNAEKEGADWKGLPLASTVIQPGRWPRCLWASAIVLKLLGSISEISAFEGEKGIANWLVLK